MFDVVIAVPRTGRSLENVLDRLSLLVSGSKAELDSILAVIRASKRASSGNYEEVRRCLDGKVFPKGSLGVFVDRKRVDRPYRIGFLVYELKIGELVVRLEGDEPHNCSSLVSLGEADIAVAGLDELLVSSYGRIPFSKAGEKKLSKWGMYNYRIHESDKMKIAGSANLLRWNDFLGRSVRDLVGFFLISKRSMKIKGHDYPDGYLKYLELHRNIVFVKKRYYDIVKFLYPNLNLTPVQDVEDAVSESEENIVGVEIVQSGKTLASKNIVALGTPLFISESLYIVNYQTYIANPKVRELISYLEPDDYFSESRVNEFVDWYVSLSSVMGNSWIFRPDIVELFCSEADFYNGLRPVRLETRNWRPSDRYKIHEAEDRYNATIAQIKERMSTEWQS